MIGTLFVPGVLFAMGAGYFYGQWLQPAHYTFRSLFGRKSR